MLHEKFIKDYRGSIRIEVNLITFRFGQTDIKGNHFRYDTIVWHKAPRKKNEIQNFDIAAPHEILSAKMELWDLIKPI